MIGLLGMILVMLTVAEPSQQTSNEGSDDCPSSTNEVNGPIEIKNKGPPCLCKVNK